MFMGSLISLINASNYTKCASWSNQKCIIHPTFIDLHSNEYSQEFHYYPFVVKLYRCVGSFITLNDLSNKVCAPNKTEDLNLSIFNIITGINDSKILTKDISYKHKCRFIGKNKIQINGGITINVDVGVKNVMCVKKIIFGILLHVAVELEKFSNNYG